MQDTSTDRDQPSLARCDGAGVPTSSDQQEGSPCPQIGHGRRSCRRSAGALGGAPANPARDPPSTSQPSRGCADEVPAITATPLSLAVPSLHLLPTDSRDLAPFILPRMRGAARAARGPRERGHVRPVSESSAEAPVD